MITPKFYINNSPVKEPENWQDLLVELNYGKDQFPNSNTISITAFDWVRENYDLLISYIDGGLTGDVGITEGLPLRIDMYDGTTTTTIFDGYIDLTSGLNIKDRIKITANATNFATIDWINQVAGGFTFEYLASDDFKATGKPGYISSDLYKFVPYVNSKVPDYEQAAIVSVMAFQVTRSLIDAVEQLYNLVAEIVENWSDIEITEIIKLFLELAYIAVLLAALLKLSKEIINLIISPVKYHAGMYVRDLMKVAIDYVGEGKMTFVSDIWSPGSPYYNELIIPEKLFNKPGNDGMLGFLEADQNEQIGYYKGTFASLLEGMKRKYNAKIVVTSDGAGGGVVYFMRRDKNAQPPKYQLPNEYIPNYTYNTDELFGNYLIQYRTDNDDQNTLQYYNGTIMQVITQQVKTNYQPFVMVKQLVEVDVPFAKAVRKTALTNPEEIISQLISDSAGIFSIIHSIAQTMLDITQGMDGNTINDISTFGLNHLVKEILDSILSNILGSNSDFTALVDIGINGEIPSSMLEAIATFEIEPVGDRIGMLLLSSDHFTIPKILILNESGGSYKYNRIHVDSETTESAKSMWDNFHYINSFIPTTDRPTGNQYMKKEYVNVPMTSEDFLNVVTNNNILGPNGESVIVESLKFNPLAMKADIACRFPKIFTKNLVETFLIPTGA